MLKPASQQARSTQGAQVLLRGAQAGKPPPPPTHTRAMYARDARRAAAHAPQTPQQHKIPRQRNHKLTIPLQEELQPHNTAPGLSAQHAPQSHMMSMQHSSNMQPPKTPPPAAAGVRQAHLLLLSSCRPIQNVVLDGLGSTPKHASARQQHTAVQANTRRSHSATTVTLQQAPSRGPQHSHPATATAAGCCLAPATKPTASALALSTRTSRAPSALSSLTPRPGAPAAASALALSTQPREY